MEHLVDGVVQEGPLFDGDGGRVDDILATFPDVDDRGGVVGSLGMGDQSAPAEVVNTAPPEMPPNALPEG